MGRLPSLRSLLVVPPAAAAGAVLVATPAFAHTGHPIHGLGDGVLHPLTGPDHLLAMVAVGVVAALAHRGRAWMAPAAFLAAMVVGGAAGMAGVPLPGAEVAIVASVLLLGLAIVGAIDASGRWATASIALIALAGAAHGHAHGAEAPHAANAATYLAGFVLATAALHAVGVAVGTILRDRRTAQLGYGLATVTAGALLILS